MTHRSEIITALDKALKQRIIHLFEIYCSDATEEALARYQKGLGITLAAYERLIKEAEGR